MLTIEQAWLKWWAVWGLGQIMNNKDFSFLKIENFWSQKHLFQRTINSFVSFLLHLLSIVHCPLPIVHCSKTIVNCSLSTFQCPLFFLNSFCTLSTDYWSPSNVNTHYSWFILHFPKPYGHFSFFTVHCPLYIAHPQFLIIHCPWVIINFPMPIVQCPLSIVNYPLPIKHCPLSSLRCQLSILNTPLSIIHCLSDIISMFNACLTTSQVKIRLLFKFW